MFDSIASRYDVFNDILSAGVHRTWRSNAVSVLDPRPEGRYLDLCAGTLDFARTIAHVEPGAVVVGADFSLPMLRTGVPKIAGMPVHPVAADALSLPFPEATFSGCTIGFGLRNLADREAGLAEMLRVLAARGRLIVLEFTTPPGRLFRPLYEAYFHHVLPHVGGLLAGNRAAARYLPESVAGFPDPEALAAMMTAVGFERVRYRLLSGGIAALHTGVKESP